MATVVVLFVDDDAVVVEPVDFVVEVDVEVVVFTVLVVPRSEEASSRNEILELVPTGVVVFALVVDPPPEEPAATDVVVPTVELAASDVEVVVVVPILAAVLELLVLVVEAVVVLVVDFVDVLVVAFDLVAVFLDVAAPRMMDEVVTDRYVGVVSTGRSAVTLITEGATGVATEAATEESAASAPA